MTSGRAKEKLEGEHPTFVSVATAADPGLVASYNCTEQPDERLLPIAQMLCRLGLPTPALVMIGVVGSTAVTVWLLRMDSPEPRSDALAICSVVPNEVCDQTRRSDVEPSPKVTLAVPERVVAIFG